MSEQRIDEPELENVHGKREERHREKNLDVLVVAEKTQNPGTDVKEEREEGKNDKHSHLHEEEDEEVRA